MNKYARKELIFDLSKLPGWFMLELEELHIPHSFHAEDLSDEQRQGLSVLTALLKLVEQCVIRVRIGADGLPEYYQPHPPP